MDLHGVGFHFSLQSNTNKVVKSRGVHPILPCHKVFLFHDSRCHWFHCASEQCSFELNLSPICPHCILYIYVSPNSIFLSYKDQTLWPPKLCSHQYTVLGDQRLPWCTTHRAQVRDSHSCCGVWPVAACNLNTTGKRTGFCCFGSSLLLHLLLRRMCDSVQISVESLSVNIKLWKLKLQTIFSLAKCCNFLIITKKHE